MQPPCTYASLHETVDAAPDPWIHPEQPSSANLVEHLHLTHVLLKIKCPITFLTHNPIARLSAMFEIVAGFLICAGIVFLWYLHQEYSQYLQNERSILNRKYKAAHPTRHKARAAVGKLWHETASINSTICVHAWLIVCAPCGGEERNSTEESHQEEHSSGSEEQPTPAPRGSSQMMADSEDDSEAAHRRR